MDVSSWLLALFFFAFAALYASVGHAGATAYLAAMALFDVSPSIMRPTALVLNMLVAGVGSYKYLRAGCFSWQKFWPFALTSIPMAYLGGRIHLPLRAFELLLGIVLLFAALRLLARPRQMGEKDLRPFSLPWALWLGAIIGFLSGLVGIGGGVFLSPVLIFLRWEEPRRVLGIASLFILVNSLSGFLGLLSSAPALPAALPLWGAGVILGGWIGAEMGSKRLSAAGIQRALGVVLIIAALRALLS